MAARFKLLPGLAFAPVPMRTHHNRLTKKLKLSAAESTFVSKDPISRRNFLKWQAEQWAAGRQVSEFLSDPHWFVSRACTAALVPLPQIRNNPR